MKTKSQPHDEKSRLVQAVLDKVTAIKTPIQVGSFLLAVVFGIVVFRGDPSPGVLMLVIVFLPFVLLFVVVNKKLLETVKDGGVPLLIVILLIIVSCFIWSAYIAISIARSSREGLLQTSSSTLLQTSRRAKAQEIKDDNFRLANYLDSYRLVSGYYRQALLDCFDPKNEKDPYSTVMLLRKELDLLVTKILEIRGSELKEMYGEDEINKQVLKLQQSILALDSTKYFWDVVLRVYGERGKTYKIDEIVDTKDWNIAQAQLSQIKNIKFSDVEADFIRALGREIAIKPVNGIQAQDVDVIRNALKSLGYSSASADSLSQTEILTRYNNSIERYLRPDDQKKPFFALADNGLEGQLPIYIALYDTGILDFQKFLLKYSPEKSHSILLELMKRRISLFDVDDLNKLTEEMLQQKAGNKSAREQSNVVLFKIRDDMKSSLSSSVEVQAVLSSSNLEEYFMGSLKLFLSKTGSTEDRDLFVGVNSFVFLGQTEVTSGYGQMLQELLSYYNVFEADLMIGAVDG
jgi:hypothetical protein